MTNKFFSSVDGNHSRVASDLPSRCSRLASLSIVSRQSVLSILLLCLTLFLGVGNVLGATATATSSTSTLVAATSYYDLESGKLIEVKNSASNNYSNPIRIYANNTFTFHCKTGATKITKIEITANNNSYATATKNGTWTASGTGTCSASTTASGSKVTVTVTGTATTVTVKPSAQIRWNSVVVTYEVAAPSYTVNWTINPAAGGTLSATSGTSTTVTPNSAYTYGDPAYSVTSGTASVSQSSNTFSATPSANCTIRINMIEKPKYTVTLKDDNDTRTQASYGASVTLPSREGCEGYTFAGWSTTNNTSWTTTAPTIINAGSYTPTANIDLYPVYTKSEGTSEQYKLVSTLTNGKDYIFVTRNTAGSGYAFSSAITTGTSVTIATSGSDKIVSGTPANSIIWTASTGWILTTKDATKTNKKLKINGSSITLDATGSTNLAWTTNYGLNGASGSGSTKYYLQCSNGTFSRSTSGSTTNRVWAYEKTGGSTTYYISVPNCCTPLVSINGSFNRYHLKIFHHIIMSMFISLIFKC